MRRLLRGLGLAAGAPAPEPACLMVGDLEVEVWRKDVRGYRISILPPDGRVRLSVPWHMDDLAVRQVIGSRLAWIRTHQSAIRARSERGQEDFGPKGSVLVFGERCRLEIVEAPGPGKVVSVTGGESGLANLESADRGLGTGTAGTVVVRLPPGSGAEKCRAVLEAWYRARLKERIPVLLARWEAVIGVKAADWGIKRMKTRWGSCSIRARRIWLNLELAKKHPDCLEYVVVHELVHLLEASHNARFKALMTRFLPDWQVRRRSLLEGGPDQPSRDV